MPLACCVAIYLFTSLGSFGCAMRRSVGGVNETHRRCNQLLVENDTLKSLLSLSNLVSLYHFFHMIFLLHFRLDWSIDSMNRSY